MEQQQQQQQKIQHFSHPEHPLVFSEKGNYGQLCWACKKTIFGPSYSCIECNSFFRHKSCAELPLGLHHPLHPIHPLILFHPWRWAYLADDKQFYKCELCKEFRYQYTYRCSRCDFNLHITCASLAPTTMVEAEFHHHPLTPFWKWITFTCDICGKEDKDKGMPYGYMCQPCALWIHRSCASFPSRVKVVRHKHLLHLTHSSLEFLQPDPRFCQICVRKVDTRYGLYYCSRCNFVAHIDCAIAKENREDIDLSKFEDEDSEVDESIDSAAPYEVKKFLVGEDKTQIDTEIAHFSHEHDLNLTDEVQNSQKCNGCSRAIVPPFYSCVKCSFFLHKSCANLPKKKRHPLHQHPLILIPMEPSDFFGCRACKRACNGFSYKCERCDFNLDVQCSLISDILVHKGHEHQLILSSTTYQQNCTSCNSESNQIFRCTICEFALDFKCATLPYTTRYRHHEHPFTLCYTVEDNSGEYYCDICEEEREQKHWFYYCADCTYPAHPNCILGGCILGEYTNWKFGNSYEDGCHPHPLTFIEETKDNPQCHNCGDPCREFIFQCAPCNFYIHDKCLREDIDLQKFEDEDEVPELDESVDSVTYKVNKFNMGEDETQIAIEIKHFSHEHDLMLTDEVLNNQKCDGCTFSVLHYHIPQDMDNMSIPSLSVRAEDDSDEYYCDIYEEERRDSNYWFYYCEDCSYPAHPNCIIGKYPNYKFGDVVHISFGAWNSSNENAVILFQCSFLASWFKYNVNTLYQLMLVCVWSYPALATSVRNDELADNRNFQFSMFYGSTLFSNGSWLSMWNIKSRVDEQILELKGKLLESYSFCWIPLSSCRGTFGAEKENGSCIFQLARDSGDLIDSVLATLVEKKVVPDPFFRLQNKAIIDIADFGQEYAFLFLTTFKSWNAIH
ncbi:hypothetical protein SO802_013461 [Lithocarpus litseifolius]|uniref:Phorbol-ester/DAG-type domain-containing protein n=1 Tax=Lithocarpus litseifolius TaxID=425828 RepID=A0AAW2D9C6_9ROSI